MEYIKYLEKIKGFSEKTVITYSNISKRLEYFGFDYKKMLLSLPEYSRNTIRLILAGVISYYKFTNDDRWKEISLPKKEFNHKEYVTYDQYQKYLININHKTKTGLLKRIVVRLLFETGIRASELLWIKKSDIKNNEIKIFGKGRRKRIVKISNWLLSEINEYIKNTPDDERIFNFKYKNLYKKVKSLSEQKITPHMFRRGYAKYCFEKGISIYDISLSMGHSSIETTAGYIKRNSSDVDIYQIF